MKNPMGRRQVVRQRILTSSFGGSNPPVPVSQTSYFCIFSLFLILLKELFVNIYFVILYFIKKIMNKNNLKVFFFIFSFINGKDKKEQNI